MIDLEESGEITLVRMRHGKANAMDCEFCDAMTDTFDQLGRSDTRAVVLTGHGNIFSAGVDLVQAIDGGPGYFERFLPAMNRAFEVLFRFPKPVVAAINGHAIAGGCVLACAADRRIMANGGARIGIPELLVGVPFPAIALETMRHACAPHRFEELVYSGATVAGQNAYEWGLIDEVVPEDQVLDRASEIANSLARIRPSVFELSKLQVRMPALESFQALAARHEANVVALWNEPATLAAMRDYVSRTFKRN